jgi:hypothetical protein
MHPLHDYVASQIAKHLRERRVVVLYDRNGDLRPFMAEVGADIGQGAAVQRLKIAGMPVHVAAFTGSYLETRMAVEETTGGDEPETTLIYVPPKKGDQRAKDDELLSLLMEVEKAGRSYSPTFRQLAREALKRRFTDVEIDEFLKPEAIGYQDVARLMQVGNDGGSASILRGIFDNTSDANIIISRWLLSDRLDPEIAEKGATVELRKLLAARLGVVAADDIGLPRLRAVAQRQALGAEFLLDLRGTEVTLPGVAPTTTKDQADSIRAICERIRKDDPSVYEAIADRVQGELGIEHLSINGACFGAIDTFRIEESLVITHCFGLIANRRIAEARAVIDERQGSFWIEKSTERQAVWQVCRLMTDLGLVAEEIQGTLGKANGSAKAWVESYVAAGGWHRLDRAQRELETVVQGCEEHVDERSLGVIRGLYEDIARRMAEGFGKALAKAEWTVPDALPQHRIFSEFVAPSPKPVAYFLVDALRYEMGVDLQARIAKLASECTLRPAIASLPSITPIGMAALMPGASTSFVIADEGGKLGAKVDGRFLPDLKSRKLHLEGRIPASVDLRVDQVLQGNVTKLAQKIADKQVIIIRSQEIDEAGEAASSSARRVMSGVIEDLARCLSRLASAGIEHAVIASDHGHLFFAHERDESMRTDAPGGASVDLHRRCWIGRGGATPPGATRIPASKLGHLSDLDIVIPSSTGVFRAGGDLAYHHGGASLQELVIPVLTVRLKADKTIENAKGAVEVEHAQAITNRIFTVKVGLGQKSLFSTDRTVRVVVVHDDRQVATIGMTDPPREPDGAIKLGPKTTVTIGFMLTDDSVPSIRIQVLDGETDAVLHQSKDLPVRLGV